VLDISTSMEFDRRIVRARREMRRALSELAPVESFNIVTFFSSSRIFRRAMVPATRANIAAAISYVDGLELQGGTNIQAGLDRALSMRGVNVVVLISDGFPTYGITDPLKLAERVRRNNRRAKARIFAVGLAGVQLDGEDGLVKDRSFEATEMLQRIAQQNNGEFTLIPVE
jgi:Ca-activated chloride channel family protein